jgi:hypothetical protein
MKVNGYKIKAALDEAKLVLSTLTDQFSGSLYAFEDETKRNPSELIEEIKNSEEKVAKIQALQEKYNQCVVGKMNGLEVSLAMFIKMRGYASRIESLWKQAAKDRSEDRFSYREDPMKRSKEAEYAKRTITKSSAIEGVKNAVRWTNELKNAIATANLTEVEIDIDFDF